MNGGLLVQDCKGHALHSTHVMINVKNDMAYHITSTHHQMQYPYNLKNTSYDLLYVAACGGNYLGEGINYNLIRKNGEPEVVLYHKYKMPKCLAIQGHPEMIPKSPVAKMLDGLIHDLINDIRNPKKKENVETKEEVKEEVKAKDKADTDIRWEIVR